MSGRYAVIYSPESVEDLRDIHAHIAVRLGAPKAARQQVAQIRNAIRGLERLPLRHPLTAQRSLADAGIRRMNVGNYAVFYVADEDAAEVVVARILYGGRDVGAAFEGGPARG